MSFNVLYVTSTSSEAESLKNLKGIVYDAGCYQIAGINIFMLVSGIGAIATAWSLKTWFSLNIKPDLVINAGIAGSFKEDIRIGDVVMPVTDCFADAGIEDGDNFLTLSEAELADPHEFPYINGILRADSEYTSLMSGVLKPVRAVTVNCATGSEATIRKLVNKFNPDIETMEGATFFYICSREKIPFLAIRAISNKVEPRDKSKWDIPSAMKSLSEKIYEVIITLEKR
jgi:futalosine hydrolase